VITLIEYMAAFRSPLAYGPAIGVELRNLPSDASFAGVSVWLGNVVLLYVLSGVLIARVKSRAPGSLGIGMADTRRERVYEWWVATALVTVAVLPFSTAQVRAIGCWAVALGIIAIAETVKMRRSGGVQ
jgi:hypothetical protein